MKKSIYLSICLILASTMAFAAQFDNEKALKGLSSIKMVCDVNVGDPDLLLTRMHFLDTTYSQLLDFGVKPTIVVAFRGKASVFITKNDKYIKSIVSIAQKMLERLGCQVETEISSLGPISISATSQTHERRAPT